VRDAGKLLQAIGSDLAFLNLLDQSLGQASILRADRKGLFQLCPAFGILFEKNPENALGGFACQFNVDQIQPVG